MKKIILYLLTVAALFVFLSSHVFAQETRTFDFTDFTGISVGWGMHVNVTQASSYKIEVEADKADFEVLRVEKKGHSVHFYIDKNSYRKHDDINITIKMPILSDLSLSGGSIGKMNMNIASKDFNGTFSGGSSLDGNLTCSDLNISSSGGSTVKLSGKGENMNFDGSGGSIFKMKSFQGKNLDASLSGGSHITISMNGTISSQQSGGSEIIYYGDVNMESNHLSGGSMVTRGD